MPPLLVVTSVRAIVLRRGEALVQCDRTRRPVFPEGRREAGEAPAATLAREVREETGWSLRDAAPIGVLHYRRLAPKPPGFPYPYLGFLPPISVGQAATFAPEARPDDGFEVEAAFLSIVEARMLVLGLRPLERVSVDAAIAHERQGGNRGSS